MKNRKYLMILCITIGLVVFSCKKNDDSTDSTKGSLKGVVTNSVDNNPVANVRIIVYDALTNAPTGSSILTGTDGAYKIELVPGTYYLHLSRQGYNTIPATGITPVSVTIETGKETVSDYELQVSNVINGGFISGKVTAGGNALGGVLIIAGNDSAGYSSVSGNDGNYYIYNLPAGTYNVQGYLSGYNSDTLSVEVVGNTESSAKNIVMTMGVTGSISGLVSFLATNNGEVDVTLTNPLTKETIPGLVTKTVAGAYSITNVPNGTYIVRASYSNDNYVVDPDWILKNGEPIVTIKGNSISQNFSVTGAVKLVSPTNDSTTTVPVEITDASPTFTWQAYSSTSDYVIEVSDINGNVIWGGFTKNGATITKNIVIPKSQLAIAFNSDGKATSALKANNVYRWRIYASKDDNSSSTGWKLISVSEEQRGLISKR